MNYYTLNVENFEIYGKQSVIKIHTLYQPTESIIHI